MIQPLRRKGYKLADAHQATREAWRKPQTDLNQEIHHGF